VSFSCITPASVNCLLLTSFDAFLMFLMQLRMMLSNDTRDFTREIRQIREIRRENGSLRETNADRPRIANTAIIRANYGRTSQITRYADNLERTLVDTVLPILISAQNSLETNRESANTQSDSESTAQTKGTELSKFRSRDRLHYRAKL